MVSEKDFKVSFPGTGFPDLKVLEGHSLSRSLDVQNSPILFGCRTGICATCVCLVSGNISGADEDEREVLELFAPDQPTARLACQVQVDADLEIKAWHED